MTKTWREGSLRKSLGKYGATDERQRWFAQQGDELLISTPGNSYWLKLAKALAEHHRKVTSQPPKRGRRGRDKPTSPPRSR